MHVLSAFTFPTSVLVLALVGCKQMRTENKDLGDVVSVMIIDTTSNMAGHQSLLWGQQDTFPISIIQQDAIYGFPNRACETAELEYSFRRLHKNDSVIAAWNTPKSCLSGVTLDSAALDCRNESYCYLVLYASKSNSIQNYPAYLHLSAIWKPTLIMGIE